MGYKGAETDPSISKLVKIGDSNSNLKGQKVFCIAKVLVKLPSKHSTKCILAFLFTRSEMFLCT